MKIKKLDKEKLKDCLWQIENSIGKSHADYTIEKHIADGLFEMLKFPFWKFFTAKKWEWKYEKAINKHKECCDLSY